MTTRYYPFNLTLQAPLLVTELGGDPNSATSLPFIPGSAIRGAVAGAVGGNAALLQEMVLGGAVRYLNAYPLQANERALPAPRSFRAVKGARPERNGTEHLYDLAAFTGVPDEEHDTDNVWPKEELAPDSSAFLVMTLGDEARRADVRLSSRVHQQRDRAKGHAWKEGGEAQGTIFSYGAIEPGQGFRGMLLIEGADEDEVTQQFERVRSRLPDRLLLGRSRRAGYGGDAEVAWGNPRPREVEGSPVIQAGVPAGAKFRVLLTAPYLGRDQETGQPDPAALGPELLDRLGNRGKIVALRGMHSAVGGYNRTWGLPLPQRPVMAAGTVIVIEARDRIPLQELVAIEHAGLGERRIEGFGRVCFLEPATQQVPVKRLQPNAQRPTHPPPSLITQIEERLVEDRLDREIRLCAAQLAMSAKSLPSTALISRLRAALHGDPAGAVGRLATSLGDGEQALRPQAMRQLERCRLSPNGSAISLRDRLRRQPDARQLGQLLRFDAIAQQAAFDPAQPARATLDGSTQAIWVGLVDATLAALARRNRAEGSTR